MKKFLMTISKKNIPKIFLLFLAFLLIILFSSAKTVYAASGSSILYEGNDFNIVRIYNSGTEAFLDVNTKKRISNTYAEHMDFNKITVFVPGGNYVDFSLICVNENANGFIYSSYEKYLIVDYLENNENIIENCRLVSISNINSTFSLSSANIVLNYIPYATLRLANACGIISCHSTGWPWDRRYESYIFFSLYVDGVGYIEPKQLNSIRFMFLSNSNKVTMVANNPYQARTFFGPYKELGLTSQDIPRVLLYDAYQYDCDFVNPTMSNYLRSSFSCDLYSCDEMAGSEFEIIDNYYSELPNGASDNLNFLIHMNNGPKFSNSSLGGTKTNDFAIIQFTYWEGDSDNVCSLNAASLNNGDSPLYVVHDDVSDEDVVLTVDPDTGEIIPTDDYYVDPLTGLPRDAVTNEEVGYDERNDFNLIYNPSLWDKLSNFFKTILTITLSVLVLILIVRIVGLFRGFSKKDNNVNITVKSSSNKYRRKKK